LCDGSTSEFFYNNLCYLPTKKEEILGNWVCCPLNFIIISSSSSSIFAQKTIRCALILKFKKTEPEVNKINASTQKIPHFLELGTLLL
jgi:hypothetical protein